MQRIQASNSIIKTNIMDPQQNPNEPGKSNTPGQQGGQGQDRERQERERREREKQGGATGWRPARRWPARRTIRLLFSKRSERREATPAAALTSKQESSMVARHKHLQCSQDLLMKICFPHFDPSENKLSKPAHTINAIFLMG